MFGVYLVGVWGLSGIPGHRRRSDVFGGYLASQSLQFGAVILFWHRPERPIFSRLTKLSHQNIKMVGFFPFFLLFKACQIEIINTVAIDHPVYQNKHCQKASGYLAEASLWGAQNA